MASCLCKSLVILIYLISVPRFSESSRLYPSVSGSGSKIGINVEEKQSRDASSSFRSLQTNKQQDKTDSNGIKLPAVVPPSTAPAMAFTTAVPAMALFKTESPTTTIPVLTFPTAAPLSIVAPSTPTPVIRYDSSWQSLPSPSPIAGGTSPTQDQEPTEWAFTMITDPQEFGGLLLVPLQEYLPGSNVVHNPTDDIFTVTSPPESVTAHQAAILDSEELQRHMQRSQGEAFLVLAVEIVTNTAKGRQFTNKEIALLIAFGISMTVIIAGFTGIFFWKKPEIGENEVGSQEWTYDKNKEDQLAMVDTLSSAEQK